MRMHVVVEWRVDEGKQIYKFKKQIFFQKLKIFIFLLTFIIFKFALAQDTGLKRYELETFRNINLKFVRKKEKCTKIN